MVTESDLYGSPLLPKAKYDDGITGCLKHENSLRGSEQQLRK